MVCKESHTCVFLFFFRLAFGSSSKVGWSSGRSVSQGTTFVSSGRSVVVGIMFAGEARWLRSLRLPTRRPLEPTESVLIDELVVDEGLAAVDLEI